MARITGIQTKKNSKGNITHVTIDLRKYSQAIPFLTQLGVLEADDFEKEWNDPSNMTVEESKASHYKFIESMPWKK